jgi:hypothetical protein
VLAAVAVRALSTCTQGSAWAACWGEDACQGGVVLDTPGDAWGHDTLLLEVPRSACAVGENVGGCTTTGPGEAGSLLGCCSVAAAPGGRGPLAGGGVTAMAAGEPAVGGTQAPGERPSHSPAPWPEGGGVEATQDPGGGPMGGGPGEGCCKPTVALWGVCCSSAFLGETPCRRGNSFRGRLS